MRLAFFTTVLSGRRQTGGEVASQAFLDAFHAAGHEVMVVGYGRRSDGYVPRGYELMPAVRRIETQGAGLACAVWMGRALLNGAPYGATKYVSRAYARAAGAVLRDWRPDVAVIDHAQTGWLLSAGFDAPYVYLAHNVERELHAPQVAAHAGRARGWAIRREARRIGALEARLARGARRIWALSAADAARLSALAGPGRTRSLGLPAPPVANTRPTGARPDIALLGTWSWRPNLDGLRWFLGEVLPLLPDDWRVEIAGRGGEETASGPPVIHRGRAQDATAFLANARTIAVPAVAGGGVKVSVLHAIATGAPVVTTPLGLRGLENPPPNVHVADTATAFAQALRRSRDRAPSADAQRVARAWTARRQSDFTRAVADELAVLEPVGACVARP
jgi:glycosyl transferase family 1/glycosyl transferase family 4